MDLQLPSIRDNSWLRLEEQHHATKCLFLQSLESKIQKTDVFLQLFFLLSLFTLLDLTGAELDGTVTLSKCDTTMHVSTLCPFWAHLAIDWSQIFFNWSNFSPRHTPSVVTRTRAWQSNILSAKESAEKPANYKTIFILCSHLHWKVFN